MKSFFLILSGILLLLCPFLLYVNAQSLQDIVNEADSKHIGYGYVELNNKAYTSSSVLQLLKQSHIRWVGISLTWQQIEPRAPKGSKKNLKHSFKWKSLDSTIKAWHNTGKQVFIKVTPYSKWGSDKNGLNALPSSKYQTAYKDFAKALVERYDYDGQEDMSGLVFPIVYYQFGEFQPSKTFSINTSSLKNFMATSYSAAHEAFASARVISPSFSFLGNVNNRTTSLDKLINNFSEFSKQSGACASAISSYSSAIKIILSNLSSYDVFGLISDTYPSNLRLEIKFLSKLSTRSKKTKRLWVTDCRALPLMDTAGLYNIQSNPFEEIASKISAGKLSSSDKELLFKIRAQNIFKKSIVGMATGANRIIATYLADSQTGNLNIDYSGILETRQKGKGFTITDTRPAYNSIALLARDIDQYTSKGYKALSNGTVYYSFLVNSENLFVIWNTDYTKRSMATISPGYSSALSTDIFLSPKQKGLTGRFLKTKPDGTLDVSVDYLPVIVKNSNLK